MNFKIYKKDVFSDNLSISKYIYFKTSVFIPNNYYYKELVFFRENSNILDIIIYDNYIIMYNGINMKMGWINKCINNNTSQFIIPDLSFLYIYSYQKNAYVIYNNKYYYNVRLEIIYHDKI